MLGVIPCGGLGSRWNYYNKDLLPLGKDKWLLNNAIETAAMNFECDKVLLVTSTGKIAIHANHLSKHRPSVPVSYAITYGDKDMWQGIEPALDLFPDENVVLIMPDTIFETNIHKNITAPSAFGVFETQEPERYSVLLSPLDRYRLDRQYKWHKISSLPIETKNVTLAGKGPLKAWGAVYWNKEVVKYWNHYGNYNTYDEAFNAAAVGYGYATFYLYKYYDMANFEEYLKYIKDRY